MSTKLYTRAGSPSNTLRRYKGHDSLVDGQSNGVLIASAGPAASGLVATSVSGPSEIVVARFQTDPLAADVTISSTFSWNLWGLESSMNANASFKVSLYVLGGSGGSLIGSSSSTSEFGTSSALRTGSFTPTSTLCRKGDALGVVISFVDAGGTMGNGFTLTFRTDGPTGGADGDSFVTFTENLTFDTTAPSSTLLYFTDVAADLDVGGSIEKLIQIGGSAPSFTKVTDTFTGPGTTNITDGPGGSGLVWFTPPLEATTIAAGIWNVSLDFFESSAAANATGLITVGVTDEDGTDQNSVLTRRLNGAAAMGLIEMTTASGDAAIVYPCAAREITITNRQRLKIFIYITDAMTTTPGTFGTTNAGANMASGQTVTTEFGPDSFLQLPSPISIYTRAPRPIVRPSVAVHRSYSW